MIQSNYKPNNNKSKYHENRNLTTYDDDTIDSVSTIDFTIGDNGVDYFSDIDIDNNIFNDEESDEANNNNNNKKDKYRDIRLTINSNDEKTNDDSNITSSSTKTLKDEKEAKKLANRKERRKRYEIRVKLRNLKFPNDDIRRTMMQRMMTSYGTRNFKALKSFLDENALPQFLLRTISIIETLSNENNCDQILPNKTEIRGIDNSIDFLKSLSHSLPDELQTFSKIVVKCGLKSSCIYAEFSISATPVFDIILNTTREILGKL